MPKEPLAPTELTAAELAAIEARLDMVAAAWRRFSHVVEVVAKSHEQPKTSGKKPGASKRTRIKKNASR